MPAAEIELLSGILQALMDIRGRDRIPQIRSSDAPDHTIGDIDTNIQHVNQNFKTGIVNRVTFINIPSGLTTFLVRLNSTQSQAIDILQAGNIIESTVPIKEMFVTTAPGITGPIKYISGNLKIFQGAASETAAAAVALDNVISDIFTHTMVAADDLTLSFPAVPATESHEYDQVSIHHDRSLANGMTVRLSIVAPAGFTASQRTVSYIDDLDNSARIDLLNMQQITPNTDDDKTVSAPSRSIKLYQGEVLRIEIYGRLIADSFVIGSVITVQYRRRVLAAAATFAESEDAITAVEAEYVDPDP